MVEYGSSFTITHLTTFPHYNNVKNLLDNHEITEFLQKWTMEENKACD